MALMYSSSSQWGALAPNFSLPNVDGRTISLSDYSQSKGLLIVFICNHCPYVIATIERFVKLAKEIKKDGIETIMISSNDVRYREEDSFEKMKIKSVEWGFEFPYLYDESQEVAKAFDAVCTPDPYLYEKTSDGFRLRFRGRLDDSWKDPAQVKVQDLKVAVQKMLNKDFQNERVSGEEPIPSMGCSIKWKELTK